MLESTARSGKLRCLCRAVTEGIPVENQSVLVRVPATVGNFGGAIDCAALSLDAALNVKATPRVDGEVSIRYFGENGERVPRDRSNLVVRAMESALRARGREFTGAQLEIFSSVPVAVGLGSSTAAVLAGLIAADQLYRLHLDDKSLFGLASEYEDRHDNLRAAWLGGFVICAQEGSHEVYRRAPVPENFSLHVVVPETTLNMETRRKSRSAGAVSAGDHSHLSRATAIHDLFTHPGNGQGSALAELLPPTCEKNVAGLEEALQVRVPGVLSIFVCGTGPAVGILAQENASRAVPAIRECFAGHAVASLAAEFRPTNSGAREWNAVSPEIALAPLAGRLATAMKSPLIPA